MINTLAQEIICPVCQQRLSQSSPENIPYPAKGASKEQRALLNEICFCPVCKTGIALPILDQKSVDSLYENGDYWQNYQVKILSPFLNPGHFAMAKSRWAFIEQKAQLNNSPNISILDVGGGYGYIGMAAAESAKGRLKKFSVVEKDKFFRQSLQLTWQKFHPLIPSSVEENLSSINDQYNVIIFSHILEHLPQPINLLEEALSKLSDGGVIFVDVPHQDFIYKENVFPHVLFYTPVSLRRMFERLNLETISIECFGRDRHDVNHKRKINRSLMNLSEKAFYKARHLFPLDISIAFFNYYFMNHHENPNGTWIRAIARKKGRL